VARTVRTLSEFVRSAPFLASSLSLYTLCLIVNSARPRFFDCQAYSRINADSRDGSVPSRWAISCRVTSAKFFDSSVKSSHT